MRPYKVYISETRSTDVYVLAENAKQAERISRSVESRDVPWDYWPDREDDATEAKEVHPSRRKEGSKRRLKEDSNG